MGEGRHSWCRGSFAGDILGEIEAEAVIGIGGTRRPPLSRSARSPDLRVSLRAAS